MAKTKISEFSATPGNNTDIDGINIAEGCAPSGINDAIRELMSQLKDFQAGTAGDSFNGPVGTTTAAAGAFTTLSSTGNTTLGDASGDSVTINGNANFANVNPTLTAGTANGVAYLNGSKVLTTGSALTFDGTNLGVNSAGIDWKFGGTVYANATISGLDYVFTTSNGAVPIINSGASVHIWRNAGNEGMRLTSTGLGIGTSSPASKLEVSGAGSQTFKLTNTTGVNAYIQSYSTSFAVFGTSNNYPVVMAVNGGEVARFDTSGNLGLGVTPSAWGSTFKAFQFAAAASVYGQTDYNSTYVACNSYYDGTNNKYLKTDYATSYRQYAGTHAWFTAASGTAGNAITFTQAMTLDASGNLLVGGTSQSGTANKVAVLSSDKFGLSIIDTSSFALGVGGALNLGGNYRGAGDAQAFCRVAAAKENATEFNFAYALTFSTTPNGGTFTERARIDSSGNLLVGTTSALPVNNAEAFSVQTGQVRIQRGTDGSFIVFYNSTNSAQIGSITNNGGTSTAYNTSSDYRLKENIQPMTGALAKVAALKPVTYKWKADGSDGEGFIAHELAEVVPQCVTGEKDAVDADGKPVYQGIDTSFLVATLTAAIQELKAEFDAYKATHP